MMKQLIRIAACVVLVAPLYAADSSDFEYTLPPGWVDLVDRSVDVSQYPSNPVNEARSGRYRIYAIDPNNLSDRGANALLNVIEMPQTGKVTQAVLDRSMNEAESMARARGFTWTTLDKKIAQLGNVDIGVVNTSLGNEAGTLRLVQYFIPGKTKAAVMTYGCKPDQFERYRTIFETSAMATKGAYAHGFNVQRALGPLFLAIVITALIVLLVVAKSRGPSPAPAVSVQPQSTTMWECPTCKRHVPARIDVCRCGTARPM